MAAVLADTAVALSVALQHGVAASAMATSIARRPVEMDGPPVRAASVVGAALDLLVEYEPRDAEMALVREAKRLADDLRTRARTITGPRPEE